MYMRKNWKSKKRKKKSDCHIKFKNKFALKSIRYWKAFLIYTILKKKKENIKKIAAANLSA